LYHYIGKSRIFLALLIENSHLYVPIFVVCG